VVRSPGGALVGEVIRRTKDGKFIGFYLRWYEGGKRRIQASKQPTHAEAKRMLQAIEGRIARGLAGLDEPVKAAPALTVAELVERFLAEYNRPRIKDAAAYRSYARSVLRRVLPQLGASPVDAVKPSDIAKLRDGLSKRFADASVRLTLTFLATAFSWALREGLAPHNPCKGVERPQGRALLEFLSKADAERLLEHARAHALDLHPMIATALYTGLRKGELFGLTWRCVDFDQRRLDVLRSGHKLPKGGKPRHLRLPSTLVPILSEWRDRCPPTPEGLVFPVLNRVGRSNEMLGLEELLEKTGCPPFRRSWHALRHTFASHFVMAGGNILALQKILGHQKLEMTLVYAHLAPDFLGDEMERVRFKSG
jgi:integrase